MIHSKTLDDIKKYIEDGEMSFLIGAGFSRNVNEKAYLMWGGLLKDAVWELFGSSNRVKSEDNVMAKAVKEYGYLGIASMMVKKAGYHEAIDTYIESKTPYIKTVGGKPVLLLKGNPLPNKVNSECHLLLKNLNIQNIYTFNYDNALEYLMGDEARRELEVKIENSRHKIEELKKTIENQKQQESTLKERLRGSDSMEGDENLNAAVEKSDQELPDAHQIEQELLDLQKKIYANQIELNECRSCLVSDKINLKTFYNVVKDSYEISLSAKRKSIYKIHGSLREKPSDDYGFDGDTHTQYIITQEDYDTYNDKHSAFVNMMRIDLLRNRFCIMGVSGSDANFLAWINWVKDVLDKAKDRVKQGKEDKHQSYFIYSGNDDMTEEMALMLRNHFIEPVILKEVFPDTKNDEQRIKLFLEYMQPFSNNDASRFSKLWRDIKAPRNINSAVEPVSDTMASELFRLSSFNKFNGPHSVAHYTATNVQFSPKIYLKESTTNQDRMVYAAALQSSLMPIDLSCDNADFVQMSKETDDEIKKVFEDACCRGILLQHLPGKYNQFDKEDHYTRLLYKLYDYKFPTKEDVEKIGNRSGTGFVRQYSLMQLLQRKTSFDDHGPGMFNSPQEFILATDWLKYLGYENPLLYKKADEYRHRGRLMSLYDYYKGYLSAMRRKEELDTYGNVSETFYLDKYNADITNAAVLLNSFVELGICFAGHTMMDDSEWLEMVRALKQRYPVPLAFYTIARNGKEKSIKLVAQELMYDDNSRRVLPTILKNILYSLIAESTPIYLKGKMAQFASEILPAVDPKRWLKFFVANAETILDLADMYDRNLELSKALYGYVANALEHVPAKELRIKLLKRILENMDLDDEFGSYYNTLAISARERLKPSDFAYLYDAFVAFIEKTKHKTNQQANFVIMNLLVLLDKEQKKAVLKTIEDRAVKDVYLLSGYIFHIKDYPDLIDSFNRYFLQGEDLWNSGITNTGIHMGIENNNLNQFDKLLHFNEGQVNYIYNDLKLTLGKIDNVFHRKGYPKTDKGWMSPENNFREIVMNMRLFIQRHHNQLSQYTDFENTNELLDNIYERCFWGKNVCQLIADDMVYRAIRRIMTEVDMVGIKKYRLEYEQILGRIITKNTNELGIALRHVSWAMKHYNKFFNTDDFKAIFETLLKVYKPYFDIYENEDYPWNLKGCQKEVAEKALVQISKTLDSWGVKDEFWGHYKRVFYN